MSKKSEGFVSSRRQLLVGAGLAAVASQVGLASGALAAVGPKRKLIWVPQALGDWDTAFQVGAKDFCELAGWEYQRTGNPTYSVENHVEQVNNAIAAKADVILTELESPGLVASFQRGIDQGVTMVIVDQGIEEEAAKLGLGIINQDEYNAGILNGYQAATFAEKQTGKKEGIIVLGNGNPGASSIDKRQNGSEEGIKKYNTEHGTNYSFEAFPDGSFGELTESIQKWTAQFGQKGPDLVAAIGTGNPTPIYQAMQEQGMAPGSIAVGSTDIPPAHQKAIADGWVQWGIDQQFYMMGFFGAAAAFGTLEAKYPYPSIHTGGEVVTTENLKKIGDRSEIWLAKAKSYGFM
jgi:simple sugar transport system substrate-binding protein